MTPRESIHVMTQDLKYLLGVSERSDLSVEEIAEGVKACDRFIPQMQNVRASLLAQNFVDAGYDIKNQRVIIQPTTPEAA